MSQNVFWKFDPEKAVDFDPRFRKATTLMRILVGGLEQTLKNSDAERAEVFLGSLHGEIEPTFNYLKGLAQTGVGRPFLFQNSLHHSTTGFISQQFQFLGPTYSLCVIDHAQEEIMFTALLQGIRNRNPLLLIHADSFPQELGEVSDYEVKNQGEFLFLDQATVESLEIQTETEGLGVVESFEQLLSHLENKKNFKLVSQQFEIAFRVK